MTETLDATVLLDDIKTWNCEGCNKKRSAALGELIEGYECSCGKTTKALFSDNEGKAYSSEQLTRMIQEWDSEKRTFVKKYTP